MREQGKIAAVKSSNGVVRLDVEIAGEIVTEVLALERAGVQRPFTKGMRVFVEMPADSETERVAWPYEIQAPTDNHAITLGEITIVIKSDRVEIRTIGGSAVQIPTWQSVDDLRQAHVDHGHEYINAVATPTATSTPIAGIAPITLPPAPTPDIEPLGVLYAE